MSPSSASSIQLQDSSPSRSRSTFPVSALVAAGGAVLTLILHFTSGPEATLAASLLGFAATIGATFLTGREEPSIGADSAQLDALLKEIRTIPAITPNVRLEINTQNPALRAFLNSLSKETRAQVEGFLDRATRRVRDAESQARPAQSTSATQSAPTAGPAQIATPGTALKIDAILIDDEESVHMAWKVAAGRAGKTVLTFKSVDEILALPGLSRIPLETRFVVDSSLAQGTKGVVAAKALYDRGFRNLALAHPEPKKLLEPMPTWITQVIDKRPQFS